MPYKECWELQQSLFERRLDIRRRGEQGEDCGTILTVEHTPVYTLGKSGNQSNMLIPESYLQSLGAEFFHIDRGGDITFHGPGQIVCYPILDIGALGIGLRRYIEILEQAVIDTLTHYGISAERFDGATGVWICDRDQDSNPRNWRKICAIGVRASHFVTMHGLALNVTTDLKWFTMINPCGFTDKGVTSISKEVGGDVDIEQTKQLLVTRLTELLTAEVK